MAQIIKHRRGTPEQLKTKTLNAAEIGVSTGSFFSGTPIVHIGDGANASGFVVGRLHYGSTVPTLTAGNIGASYNDIQFYDTATYKLVYLHTAGNSTLDLTGNIAGQFVTGSLGVSGSFTATGSNFSIQSDGSVSGSGASTGSFGHLVGDGGGITNLTSAAIASYTNSGNNRLVSSVDSSTVNGEANATFDGTLLSLTGSLDVSVDVDVDGTLEADAITVGGSALNTVIAGVTVTNATTAAVATTVTISDNESTNEDNAIIFTSAGDVDGGNIGLESDGTLTYNPSTGKITATGFIGALTGNADTVTSGVYTSNNLSVMAATTSAQLRGILSDETGTGVAVFATSPTLVTPALGTPASGVATNLTGTAAGLTAGAVSTIAGLAPNTATTQATQPNITSLGTLTTLTVDSVIVNGTTIGHTSDTELMTLADGKLTIAGSLDVMGTTTFISSSQLDIGDRIIELNAGAAAGDGGFYIRDEDTAETGSLLWDVSEDRWIGGLKDAEVNLVTISSTDTLTNKTLTTPTIGSFTNATHTHADSANGGQITLGTGTTGNYVSTAVAGSGIDVSGATGNVTISIGTGEVVNAMIGDDEIDSEHYAAGSIDNEHLADDAVDSDELAAGAVDDAHLSDGVATGLAGAGTTATSGVINVIGGDGITANANDVAITSAQTTITSLLATDIKIGEDDQTKIDFETADEIHFYAANVEQVYLGDNIFGPQSDSDVDLGSTGVRWKDVYVDSITVTGEIDGDSLDIEGNADINGTANLDDVDIDGTLNVAGVADFVGELHAQAGFQVSASALEVGSDLKLNYSTTTVPRIMYQAADETVDFVTAPSSTSTNGDTAGEYVQWNGSAWAMTQTIDGGSF